MNTGKLFLFSLVLAGMIFSVSFAQQTFDIFVASNRGISQPKLSYLVRQTVKPPIALRRESGHNTNDIPQKPNNLMSLTHAGSIVQFRRQAMKNMFYNNSNTDEVYSYKSNGDQHLDATQRSKQSSSGTNRAFIDTPSSSFSNRNVRSSKSRSILANMFKKIRGFRDIVPPNNRLQRSRDISSYWPDIANDKLQPIGDDDVYQEEDFRVFRGNGNVFLPPTSTSGPVIYTESTQTPTTGHAIYTESSQTPKIKRDTIIATSPPFVVKKEEESVTKTIAKEIVGEHKIETFSDSDKSQHQLPVHYNVLNPSTETVPDISSQASVTTNQNRSKDSQDLVVSFIKYNKTSLSNFSFEDKKLPDNIKDVNIQSSIDETLKEKNKKYKDRVHIVIHKFPYNAIDDLFKGKKHSRDKKHFNHGKLFKHLLQLTKPIPLNQLLIKSAGVQDVSKNVIGADRSKQIIKATSIGREEESITISTTPELQQVRTISVSSRFKLNAGTESTTNSVFDVNNRKSSESDRQQADNAQNNNFPPKFSTLRSQEKSNIGHRPTTISAKNIDSTVFSEEFKSTNRPSLATIQRKEPTTESIITASFLTKSKSSRRQDTSLQPLVTTNGPIIANNPETTDQTTMLLTTSNQHVLNSTQIDNKTELSSRTKTFSAGETLTTKEEVSISNSVKNSPGVFSKILSTGKQDDVKMIHAISIQEDKVRENVDKTILPSNMTVKVNETQNIANNTFSGGDSFALDVMSDYIEEFVHLKNATKNKKHRFVHVNNADGIEKQNVVGIKIEEEKLKLLTTKMKNKKNTFDDFKMNSLRTVSNGGSMSPTKTNPAENILKHTQSSFQQATTPLVKLTTERLLSQVNTTKNKGYPTTVTTPKQINEPTKDTIKTFSNTAPPSVTNTTAGKLSDVTREKKNMNIKVKSNKSVVLNPKIENNVDIVHQKEQTNETVISTTEDREHNDTQLKILDSPVNQTTITKDANITTTIGSFSDDKNNKLASIDSKISSNFPDTIRPGIRTKQQIENQQNRKPKGDKSPNITKNDSQNSGNKFNEVNNLKLNDRAKGEALSNKLEKKNDLSPPTLDITRQISNAVEVNRKNFEEDSMNEQTKISLKKEKVSKLSNKIKESGEDIERMKSKTKNSSSRNGKNQTNVKPDIGQKNTSHINDLLVDNTSKTNDFNVNTNAKSVAKNKKVKLQERLVTNTTSKTSGSRSNKSRKNRFPKKKRDNKSEIKLNQTKEGNNLQDRAMPIDATRESDLYVKTNASVVSENEKEKLKNGRKIPKKPESKNVREIVKGSQKKRDDLEIPKNENNYKTTSQRKSTLINKTSKSPEGKGRKRGNISSVDMNAQNVLKDNHENLKRKEKKDSSLNKKNYTTVLKIETTDRNILQVKEIPIEINPENKKLAEDTNVTMALKKAPKTMHGNISVGKPFEMTEQRDNNSNIKVNMKSLSPTLKQDNAFNKAAKVEKQIRTIHRETSTKSALDIKEKNHGFLEKVKSTTNKEQIKVNLMDIATKEKQTYSLQTGSKTKISDKRNTLSAMIIRKTIKNLKNSEKGVKGIRVQEPHSGNMNQNQANKRDFENKSKSTTNTSLQSNTSTTKVESTTILYLNISVDKQSEKSNLFPKGKTVFDVQVKKGQTDPQNITAFKIVASLNTSKGTTFRPIQGKPITANVSMAMHTKVSITDTSEDKANREIVNTDLPNINNDKNAIKKSILAVIVPTKMHSTKVDLTTPSPFVLSQIDAKPLKTIFTKLSKTSDGMPKKKMEGREKYEKSPEKNHFVIKENFENNLSFQIPLDLVTTTTPNLIDVDISNEVLAPKLSSIKVEKEIDLKPEQISDRRSDIKVESNLSEIPTNLWPSKEDNVGSKSRSDVTTHQKEKNSMIKDVKQLIPPPPPVIPTATVATATENIIRFIGKASDLIKKLNGKKNDLKDLMSHTNMGHLNGNTMQPVFKLSKTEQKIDLVKSTRTIMPKDTTSFPPLQPSTTPENLDGSDKDLGKGQRISAIFTRPASDVENGIRPSAFDSRLNNVYDFDVPGGIFAKDVNGKPSGNQPFVEWLARGKNGQVEDIPPEILTKTKQISRRKVLDSSNSSIPDILKSNLDSKTYPKPKMPFMNPLRNLQKYPNSGSCNSSLGKEEIMSLAVNVLRLLVSNLKLQQALQRSHEHIVSTQFHSRRYLLIPLPEDSQRANRTSHQFYPKIGKYTLPSSDSLQHQIETFLNVSSLNANLALSPLVKRQSLWSDRNQTLTSHEHEENVIQDRKPDNLISSMTMKRQLLNKDSKTLFDKKAQFSKRDSIKSNAENLEGGTKTVDDKKSVSSKARIQFH